MKPTSGAWRRPSWRAWRLRQGWQIFRKKRHAVKRQTNYAKRKAKKGETA